MKSNPSARREARRGRRDAGWLAAALLLGLATAACRQDMHNQPKYIPLRDSDFFANGSSARPLPPDTVARGTLEDDAAFYTGKVNGVEITELPIPLTQQVPDRGAQRYDIYCSPCHDRTGSGEGMIVRRGYKQPPSYHIDRLRQAPIGHFFDVMTNGFGAMPDYAAQVTPRVRWAIVAYMRSLQLSHNANVNDVAPADRPKLDQPAPATGWWSSAGFGSRHPFTSIGCARRTPATSST